MSMTLADLNYCVIEETRRRKEHRKDMIRLAWYTAYFMRVEKLESLSTYLAPGEKNNTAKSISPEEAEKIYKKIVGGDKGGKNA